VDCCREGTNAAPDMDGVPFVIPGGRGAPRRVSDGASPVSTKQLHLTAMREEAAVTNSPRMPLVRICVWFEVRTELLEQARIFLKRRP
jgi:hypothetical protein